MVRISIKHSYYRLGNDLIAFSLNSDYCFLHILMNSNRLLYFQTFDYKFDKFLQVYHFFALGTAYVSFQISKVHFSKLDLNKEFLDFK